MNYQYVVCAGHGASAVSKKFECDNFFNSFADQPQLAKNPFLRDSYSDLYEAAAERIVNASDVTDGICLLIGCEKGRLAYELAARRHWRVIAFDEDPRRVAEARKNLRAAGIYGSQVTVHAVDSLQRLPVVEGFADIVVSDRQLLQGNFPATAGEICRILRPGGIAVLLDQGDRSTDLSRGDAQGKRERVREETPAPALGNGIGKTAARSIERWLSGGPPGLEVVAGGGNGVAVARRATPHAGVWTHEYGLPNNSAFGGETLGGALGVQDLRVQWIGRPGPRAQADRNGRKPSPLAVNGRLFVQGLERITALNSFNGTILWSLEIPGFLRFNIPRDCGNWCADDDHVFAVVKDRCWQINAATGAVEIAYDVLSGAKRDQSYVWGYVARQGNRLVGSAVRFGTQYSNFWGGGGWYDDKGAATGKICSDRLFAYDLPSGAIAWSYSGGLVLNSTLTISEDKVYFIESRNSKVIDAETRRVMSPELWRNQFLVALDLRTGGKLFERQLNTEQGNIVFYLACSGNRLVLVASNWQYYTYGLDADSGQLLWKQSFEWGHADHGGHMSRPAIVGDEVLVRPRR